MNILGISGAIGWDGNIPMGFGDDIGDFWVHGSGATLIMNGELKTTLMEERFSRIKHDGNYPELSIQNILDYNKLTKQDIDLVVYVAGAPVMSHGLKEQGYTENKIKEYFPNCNVEFLYHHLAHSAATFYTSGFDEANVLSFDGAGDYELQPDGQWLLAHMKFSQGKDLTLTAVVSEYVRINPMYQSFGAIYGNWAELIYKQKMNLHSNDTWNLARDTYPGKVMGLAAFGDYQKNDLPEWFSLERKRVRNSNIEWEDCFPQLHPDLGAADPARSRKPPEESCNPDDLAAWSQHQFEKYLLLFLNNIPKHIRRDNLCLGGGCALNILANSKIIEQGIYKNVHVNTAPNDDGLHFGAALYKAAEYEHKIILPDDIGYLGIPYTDEDIEVALCYQSQ